jgi:hypothetical protein
MAFSSTDLDAMRTAIARGEKTVTFADRSVTYRSMTEMIEALRLMEGELATRSKQSLGASSKGF